MDKVYNGFVLENEEKLKRVIYGSMGREGKNVGGIGEGAEAGEVLAAYDRLGGLITKGGYKVQMGAFWDFLKGVKRKTPIINFVFRDIEDKEVIVPEGEQIPLEVKAATVSKKRKVKREESEE